MKREDFKPGMRVRYCNGNPRSGWNGKFGQVIEVPMIYKSHYIRVEFDEEILAANEWNVLPHCLEIIYDLTLDDLKSNYEI